jgi:hypothetical protein
LEALVLSAPAVPFFYLRERVLEFHLEVLYQFQPVFLLVVETEEMYLSQEELV